MRLESLHGWGVSPAEAIAIQRELAPRIVRRWAGGKIRTILAADVSYPGRLTRSAVVLVGASNLRPIAAATWEGEIDFPYVAGLLAFREIPAILGALRNLPRAARESADVLLCDGQGVAHPRGMGLASHLGLVLDLPSVGCAKSHLWGRYREPGRERGARSALRDERGRVVGSVVRTRSGVRPVFVSVGHRIDLARAVRLVLSSSPRYRLPEPLRLAHQLAGG